MVDKISVPILKLGSFMGFAAAVTFLAAAAYLLAVRRFCWDKRRLSVLGLFFGLSNRETAELSLLYLRLLNLIYLFVFFLDLEKTRLVFFAVTGILLALAGKKLSKAVMEAVNTVLLAGGVTAANLLAAYMKEIQFEWGLMAVYCLLALFTISYCCYFTLKSIKELSEGRLERNVAVQEKEG